jgi:hypothetical protein
MTRRNFRRRFIIWVFGLAIPLPACAGSLTVFNTTDIVAYQGAAPTPYFPGPNPYVAQQPIGSEFTTTELTISANDLANGAVALNFVYATQFSGHEVIDGVAIGAADIFLQPIAGGAAYGISLGDQLGNGGLSAGFYQVQSAATSQSIWSQRQSFIYGGAIAATTQFEPGVAGYNASAVPTVITSGMLLGGAAVAITETGLGWYSLDASIVLTAQQAALFAPGFDVLWGTGDCGNGAFLADVQELPVMEPASFLVLVTALGFSAGEKGRKRFFLKKEAKTLAWLSPAGPR